MGGSARGARALGLALALVAGAGLAQEAPAASPPMAAPEAPSSPGQTGTPAPGAAPAPPVPAPSVLAERPGARNVVYAAPGSLLWGQLVLEYERALSPSWSVAVAALLQQEFALAGVVKRLVGATGTDLRLSGVGGTVGARWFFFGEAPRGLFLAPELSLTQLRLEASNRGVEGSARVLIPALSGLVGLSASPRAGGIAFSLGLGATAGYVAAQGKVSWLPEADAGTLLVLPALRLHVGGAF